MRKPSASTVIACIALFIAVGGTATAASGLINGNKIKPGTVTAKQIKNKTITTSKLAPATVKSLQGAQGPAGAPGQVGPTGPAGAVGATGAAGRDGVVDPYYAEVHDFTLPSGESVIPLTLEVPPGDYILTAKANVWSQLDSSGNYLDCTIWTDETNGVDSANADTDSDNTINFAMMAVAPVQEKVELRCAAWDGPGAARQLKLMAIPVQ